MKIHSRQARWLAVALLSVAVLCSGAVQAGELYLFGDSLSDSGNNAIASHGGDPDQIVAGNAYVPSLPYASGVYSNGNVWVSHVAAKLREYEGAVPSLIGGDDFAFGGARVASGDDVVPSATTQLGMFLARGYRVRGDDVFVIAVGGNDLRDTLNAVVINTLYGDPDQNPVIIGTAAAGFATAVGNMVDTLQAKGAKRILVWNTPDLGLVPAVRASGPLAIGAGTSIAGAFNAALAARLSGEKGVSMFDLFATLDDIVLNSQAYGLSNVTDASGNPNAGIDPATALFWDGIHPTAAGHKVLARAVLQVWPDLLRECDDPRGYHGHDRDGRGHEDRDQR